MYSPLDSGNTLPLEILQLSLLEQSDPLLSSSIISTPAFINCDFFYITCGLFGNGCYFAFFLMRIDLLDRDDYEEPPLKLILDEWLVSR